MFYVMNKDYEIVSKHETREQAEAAKTEKEYITDQAGIRALLYGPSRAHLNHY
jgi:hypothetical protein